MMTGQERVEHFVPQKMALIEGVGAERCASAIRRILEDAITQSASPDTLRRSVAGMAPVLEDAALERLRAELDAILRDPAGALAEATMPPPKRMSA
jgi:hypothetical protein